MNDNTKNIVEEKSEKPEAKPSDTGGFYFSSFLKITDPNTEEVLVHTRGDN
jgi:hypothetical protein